jgi:threonine dehydrogenase-like Zn-dependent dehydrogenase
MRAVSIVAPRQVAGVEVPDPSPGPDEVLLQVHYVGLCGSDLNTFRGLNPLVTYPRIPGHEVSGVIVAKGAAVPERLGLGQRVMVSPYSACGLCPACRVGRPNCCQFNETLGVQRDGALAPWLAVPYAQVYGSDKLSLQELALVEPLSVGYHAANRGRVSEADTVLVLGAGTVGLGAIAASARKGATVIACDIDEDKLRLATLLGATHVIHSAQEDPLARVRELTGGEGVSVAIEAVGLPATYRLAVEAASFAGRVVYIGYAKEQVTFDTTAFVRKELDILGARNALRVFPSVIQMLERRERPFLKLISRIYPLAQTAQALADWDAAPTRFTKILIAVTD